MGISEIENWQNIFHDWFQVDWEVYKGTEQLLPVVTLMD